jgi:hypothetical protein
VIGLLLRLTAVLVWPFGFDQVQIMDNARAIASGDLTLIGPRTGPASLFTGPLIYYVVAGFYVLGFGEWSLLLATLIITVATGIILFWLWRRYFGQSMAKWGLLLWSLSLVLIRYDQVTWNPNLMLLAVSLVVYPLLVSGQRQLKLLDFLLIFLGAFLSYQAHFAGFLLLPLVGLFFLVIRNRQAFFGLVSLGFGLLFSLVPTIWFDYRHGWSNVQGLWKFVQQLGLSRSDSLSGGFFESLWKSFYTTFEGLGKLVLDNFSFPVEASFLLGLAIFIVYSYYFLWKRKNNQQVWLVVLWVVVSLLFLSLYRGDKPPYYFLMQYPIFIFILAKLLDCFAAKNEVTVGVVVWAIGALLQSMLLLKNPGSLSLFNLIRVRDYFEQVSRVTPMREIALQVPTGEEFGLRYMLQDIPRSAESQTVWYLSYPGNEVIFAQQHFVKLVVWSQEDDTAKNVYVTNQFRIQTPASIRLYRDTYEQSQAKDRWLVLRDGQVVAEMKRFSKYDFAQQFQEVIIPTKDEWHYLSDRKQAVYFYTRTQDVFVFTGDEISGTQGLYADLAIF